MIWLGRVNTFVPVLQASLAQTAKLVSIFFLYSSPPLFTHLFQNHLFVFLSFHDILSSLRFDRTTFQMWFWVLLCNHFLSRECWVWAQLGVRSCEIITPLLHKVVCFQMLDFETSLRSRNQIRGKLLLPPKLRYFRGSCFSQCFILSTSPITRNQERFYDSNWF